MKPRAIYYIAAALAIALGFAVCDGIRSTDKYSIVVGKLEEAVKAANALNAEKDKVIEAAALEIVELDKKLDSSAQVISDLNKNIAVKDKNIAALRESWAGLSAECQTRLHELDTKWAEKFTLLEGVVAEKDEQIASWQGKYNTQVQISDAWKVKFEAAERVASLSGEALKLANRKLRRTQILSNVGKIALVGLGGYVLYDKLKGSK
jgi:chromosome segregation ATPase